MEEQQSEVQHAALDYDKSGQFKEHRSSTKYFVLMKLRVKSIHLLWNGPPKN